MIRGLPPVGWPGTDVHGFGCPVIDDACWAAAKAALRSRGSARAASRPVGTLRSRAAETAVRPPLTTPAAVICHVLSATAAAVMATAAVYSRPRRVTGRRTNPDRPIRPPSSIMAIPSAAVASLAEAGASSAVSPRPEKLAAARYPWQRIPPASRSRCSVAASRWGSRPQTATRCQRRLKTGPVFTRCLGVSFHPMPTRPGLGDDPATAARTPGMVQNSAAIVRRCHRLTALTP